MLDPFIESRWQELIAHLRTCAETAASDPQEKRKFVEQCESFSQRETPSGYRELLGATADAARLAKSWQSPRATELTHEDEAVFSHEDKLVDEASEESFPASDPPPFSRAHA